MERPLELALVIDGGASMQIWRRLTYEFGKMLISSGAFRRPEVSADCGRTASRKCAVSAIDNLAAPGVPVHARTQTRHA